MARFLVHITAGPEDPTRAALGLGTGALSAHVAAIRLSAETEVYYSSLSAKARG